MLHLKSGNYRVPRTPGTGGIQDGQHIDHRRQPRNRGEQVIACCREPAEASGLQDLACKELIVLPLDAGDPASITKLAESLAGRGISLYINNAGTYGRGQTLDQVDRDEWLHVFAVNTIAPLLLTRTILPLMDREGKLVYLSSKMGSIADNAGGSTYVYRSSKTALNQVVKSLSIDLAASGLSVAALHQGWVRTDMGRPNALLDAQTSVRGMIEVIDDLDEAGSGCFYNYDGGQIPW